MSPYEEVRLAKRQLLPRVVANYLVIWVMDNAKQLASLARLPTFSLHWGLAAGRPDRLVVVVAVVVVMGR